jgi:glutamate dehydrogenase (NAD(P)+)
LQKLAEKYGYEVGVKDKTFILQGFGNVGYYASKFLIENGAKMIGVVEWNSAVYNENGIDPDDLIQYKSTMNTLAHYPNAQESFGAEDEFNDVMLRKCDILIPAAVERSIHSNNADKLQCKIIAEAANGPTTVKGNKICEEKGILIIPDLVLNAGGVTVSYFEWLKNLEHKQLGLLIRRYEHQSKKQLYDMLSLNYEKEDVEKLKGPTEKDLVYSGLEEIMCSTMKDVINHSIKHENTLRVAAYKIAITRIYQMYQQVGITI